MRVGVGALDSMTRVGAAGMVPGHQNRGQEVQRVLLRRAAVCESRELEGAGSSVLTFPVPVPDTMMPGPWWPLALALALIVTGTPGGCIQQEALMAAEGPGLDDLLQQAEHLLLLGEDLQEQPGAPVEHGEWEVATTHPPCPLPARSASSSVSLQMDLQWENLP